MRGVMHAGTWAAREGKRVRYATFGKAGQNLRTAAGYRRQRRQKDLEAQRAIGDALYGGYNDEIEDLVPEERDALVREAFKHSALRARRPTVWLPRDDLGVSDDEILRTREVSEHIWISNEGTALDSKVRVVYGRAPARLFGPAAHQPVISLPLPFSLPLFLSLRLHLHGIGRGMRGT